jgi:hypothetical protein
MHGVARPDRDAAAAAQAEEGERASEAAIEAGEQARGSSTAFIIQKV